MELLELFPTVVGVFDCATFAAEGPAPRISLSFNMTLHGRVGSGDRFSRATL